MIWSISDLALVRLSFSTLVIKPLSRPVSPETLQASDTSCRFWFRPRWFVLRMTSPNSPPSFFVWNQTKFVSEEWWLPLLDESSAAVEWRTMKFSSWGQSANRALLKHRVDLLRLCFYWHVMFTSTTNSEPILSQLWSGFHLKYVGKIQKSNPFISSFRQVQEKKSSDY